MDLCIYALIGNFLKDSLALVHFLCNQTTFKQVCRPFESCLMVPRKLITFFWPEIVQGKKSAHVQSVFTHEMKIFPGSSTLSSFFSLSSDFIWIFSHAYHWLTWSVPLLAGTLLRKGPSTCCSKVNRCFVRRASKEKPSSFFKYYNFL